MSDRMSKWSVKLNVYDFIYETRNAIKSQTLAVFIAKFINDLQDEVHLEVQQVNEINGKWIVSTDVFLM